MPQQRYVNRGAVKSAYEIFIINPYSAAPAYIFPLTSHGVCVCGGGGGGGGGVLYYWWVHFVIPF